MVECKRLNFSLKNALFNAWARKKCSFYRLHLYIVWGSLTLANIGCTNQEWNEQHTARNVLSLHFANKNIFSSMNMNYKHNHKIIQTPLTPLVAFGWRPIFLKTSPGLKGRRSSLLHYSLLLQAENSVSWDLLWGFRTLFFRAKESKGI